MAATPDGAIVVDTAAGEILPKHFPEAEELDGGVGPSEGEDLAAWVLRQAISRQTSALLQLFLGGKPPQPIFVHPFADVRVTLGADGMPAQR